MSKLLWIFVLFLISIINSNSCNCLYEKSQATAFGAFRTKRSIDLGFHDFKTRSRRNLPKLKSKQPGFQAQMTLAPALLVTTSDAIALVYPKEMGYIRDYTHVVYQINNPKPNSDSTNHTGKASKGPARATYRIEDAVYDNTTWSIYFAVTNSSGGTEVIRLKKNRPPHSRHHSTGSGSAFWSKEASQFQHSNNNRSRINPKTTVFAEHPYEMSYNWTRTVVYRNSSVNILSMDINAKSKRVFWFEFNKSNKKWSLVSYYRAKKPGSNVVKFKLRHFTFDHYAHRSLFANDGYTFIAVVRDVWQPTTFDIEQPTEKQRTHRHRRYQGLTSSGQDSKSNEFKPVERVLDQQRYDIIVFISNNQTLNICYIINMTCEDYFKAPTPYYAVPVQAGPSDPDVLAGSSKPKTFDNYDKSYDDPDIYESDDGLHSEESEEYGSAELSYSGGGGPNWPSTSTVSSTTTELTSSTSTLPPLYRFGRLMGIKYDAEEHALYLADYGFDRIEKITFENHVEYDSEKSFKFRSIESILKSTEYQQVPLNPMMGVFRDNYIFWIDYEEGLKTTVYKSACVRSIQKMSEATTLRFVQIGTYQRISLHDTFKSASNRLGSQYPPDTIPSSSIHRLYSMQDQETRFQHPPDYDYIYPQGMVSEEQSTGANSAHFDAQSNNYGSRVHLSVHSSADRQSGLLMASFLAASVALILRNR